MASPAKGGRDAVGDLRKEWEGRQVDGLKFGPCLGSSGLSAVFRTDKGIIKLLRVEPDKRHFSVLERVRAFSHPNLARVLAAGRCGDGLLYVLTEYAEEDLAQVLPVRALTPAEVQDMLDPLLNALSYVHGHGFVHGRLKPSNIWVVDGAIKLSSDRLVPAGTRRNSGKLRTVYDAPETADGPFTPAADVWSLGVTIVEALTQKRPVFDETGLELPENLPAELGSLALACLNPDPRQRITVVKLWGRLHPAEIPQAAPKRRLGKPLAAVGIAAVAIAGITLVGRRSELKPNPSDQATRAAEQVLARQSQPAAPPQQETAQAKPITPQPVQQAAPQPVPPPVHEQVDVTPPAQPHQHVLEGPMPTDPGHGLPTIHGTVRVTVLVQVDVTGRVTGASLDSPGPSRYFATRALEAARRWRFVPGAANAYTVRFAFRTSGVEANAKPAGPVR